MLSKISGAEWYGRNLWCAVTYTLKSFIHFSFTISTDSAVWISSSWPYFWQWKKWGMPVSGTLRECFDWTSLEALLKWGWRRKLQNGKLDWSCSQNHTQKYILNNSPRNGRIPLSKLCHIIHLSILMVIICLLATSDSLKVRKSLSDHFPGILNSHRSRK